MSNPWELYPHIWKTKAAFFSYVRGALRRALWEKYPVKLEFKNETCTPPPLGYTGRAKSGTDCALTGEWEGKSKLEVDHIEGNKSLREWEDVLPFVQHLCTTKDNMQLVKKEAHKIKSYADRQGITFEEAVIIKDAIAICKGDEKGWLSGRGIMPESNAKLRRIQVENYLKEDI
jgi:hypothetical protein